MSKKIQLTESQFKRLMENITEIVSGYDDYHVMFLHGGKSFALLIDTLRDLMKVFLGIQAMLSSDTIQYTDLKENFKEARDLIVEISKIMDVVFKDLTERRLVRKGEILLRALKSYQEKIKTTFSFNKGDLFNNDEELKERLIKLTISLGGKLEEYALELKESTERFKDVIQKGRDKRNTNMN
jgi:hypothetical protein